MRTGADHDRAEAVVVERAREDLLDLLRRRVRRDVPVMRIDTAQGVAHRTADDVGVVTGREQAFHHLLDVRRDLQREVGRHEASLRRVSVDAKPDYADLGDLKW